MKKSELYGVKTTDLDEVKVDQTKQKSNLICLLFRQIKCIYLTEVWETDRLTDTDSIIDRQTNGKQTTVYRENFAPILFSPFSPSDLRTNLKLG